MTHYNRLFTRPPRKILIIKPSSLGDIVHSLPVLNVLYRSFPEAKIHWLIAKGFEGLLEGHPMIEKLWIINKDDWKRIAKVGRTIRELRSLFRDLRTERFDLVIDLQGLFRSGFIAKISGAPVRIGFREAREGSTVFYTDTVEGGREIHAVDRYLRIASSLGCDSAEVAFPLPPSRGSLQAVVPGFTLPAGGYAVMAPGARGKAKRWPAWRFGELASLLPVPAVMIGSRGDVPLAEEAVKASSGKALSLAGRTDLKTLVEAIRSARFMVCNDTGPMHIAAALGVPIVALFGPTNPVRTGPYGSCHRIIRKAIPCSPCYRKDCRNPQCMDMIQIEEVKTAIDGFRFA